MHSPLTYLDSPEKSVKYTGLVCFDRWMYPFLVKGVISGYVIISAEVMRLPERVVGPRRPSCGR